MGDTGTDMDLHVAYSSVPQNPGEQQKDSRVSQTVLWVLLIVALFGIAAQAFFINQLYHCESAVSALMLMNNTSGRDGAVCVLPSKAIAHLTAGLDNVPEKGVMHWSFNNKALLHDIVYKDGHLIVQKEGYYYVYSKVFFSDSGIFRHCVMFSTIHYYFNIPLMCSNYFPVNTERISNSFLGGVFHLYRNYSISVRVSTTSEIIQDDKNENIFGVFMI